MDMHETPFGTTDWSQVEATEHKGIAGVAWWRTRSFAADNAEPHRSHTATGARLFIVD